MVPDAYAITAAAFTEEDGRTTPTMLVQYTSQEDRDMHINSDMEGGRQEAMDHLEDLAVSPS
jgi:uncharacterized protein YndB with AHSA1/START domain